MQAHLDFDLPDDESNFKLATSGFELWSLLDDLDQHCRTQINYNQSLPDVKREVYEDIRQFLYDNNWGTLKDMVE